MGPLGLISVQPSPRKTCSSLFTLAVAALLFSPSLTFADLTWTTTIREISATAGDKEAVVEFPFINNTTATVSIVGVKTSCDCTTAIPSATKIASGDRGNVRVVFTLGDRVGPQEKTVSITTSEDPATPTNLVLRVNVAEVIVSNPRVLLWKVQQPGKEKTINFTATGARLIQSFSPVPATPGFTCQLEGDPETNKFQLRVTPVSTDGPASAVIRLVAQIEGRPPTAVVVYAVVK